MSHDLRKAIAWVSREVNSRALVVFSKTTCPFCVEAKQILARELGEAYALVKVIELDQLGAESGKVVPALLAISGMTTVPNIFLEGESIGGCSELKALLNDKSAGLRSRFQEAGAATIRVGDRVPNVKVKVVEAAGDGAAVRDVDTADLLRGKSAVLFGVPAAFSPSCSDRHLPSYLEHMEALKSKGIDLVLCMAVNDAFVMKAWAAQSKGLGKITFVADGNGVLAKKLGLQADASKGGMGIRSRRFALVVRDGEVTHIAVDAPMKTEISTADHVLAKLRPSSKL